jgi:putative hydrolase of the HAD superfamily
MRIPSMPVRGVFFDVFGTLLPYKSLPREVIASRRAALVGLDIPPERFARVFAQLDIRLGSQPMDDATPRNRRYWEERFALLLRAVGVTERAEEYARAMYDSFLAAGDYEVDPEALPTLDALRRRGLVVGVISNAPRGLEHVLASMGVRDFLDIIVSSEDVGVEKPDPAIFYLALQQAGLSASEAMYVGDEYGTDVLAAQKVGLQDRDGSRSHLPVPRIAHLSAVLNLLDG